VDLVDLSHVLEAGVASYPGMPPPRIDEHLSRADSARANGERSSFAIERVTMVGNSGTYLDSPWHRHEGGADLSGLELGSIADLPAVVLDATGRATSGIDRAAFDGLDVAGTAVLVRTGWDRHYGTEAYGNPDAPYLTEDAAAHLVARGARLVGIDSINIDDRADLARPVHTLLLGAGIPIVEHLCHLDALPTQGARFSAVPPAVVGFGVFPVRAWARLPR